MVHSERFAIIRSHDYLTVPWRNGRGTTLEIARAAHPAIADAFAWRTSIATICEDGPFSSFLEIERHIVIIDGSSLRLEHAEAAPAHQLMPLLPYAFSGSWPTTAKLDTPGVRHDFNLMVHRSYGRGELSVLSVTADTELTLAAGPCTHIVFLLAGGVTSTKAPGASLAAQDTLIMGGEDSSQIQLAARSTLVLATITASSRQP